MPDKYCSVLEAKLKYIDVPETFTHITPFQRAVNVSSTLYKDSAHKPVFQTTFQNGNIILTNYVDAPLSLPMSKVRIVVHRAINDFKSHVEAALPPGSSIKELPVHLLTDDFSASPLHGQKNNAEVIQPLLSDFWNRILAGKPSGSPLVDGNGLMRTEVDKWLTIYEDCYPRAASAIMVTSGGIDDSSFRHQCYAGERTVFLLKNGTISFANPLSSNRKSSRRIDLATVPPELSHIFLMLIIILLPIANGLRHLKGQVNPFHSTHLWVLPRRRTTGKCKWRYDSNSANSTLTPLTKDVFGVPLNGKIICKMIQQLFVAEFPLLLSNTMHLRSPVDDLAQHLYETGLRSYGKLSMFPSFKHLTGDKPIRNLTYCEIWHAMTKCGPINNMWKDLTKGSVLFEAQHYPDFAFRLARNLVLNHYGIGNILSSPERESLIGDIFLDKPFLKGTNVSVSTKR